MIHEMIHAITSEVRDVDFIRSKVSKKVADSIEKEIWDREERAVLHLEEVIFNLWSATRK